MADRRSFSTGNAARLLAKVNRSSAVLAFRPRTKPNINRTFLGDVSNRFK